MARLSEQPPGGVHVANYRVRFIRSLLLLILPVGAILSVVFPLTSSMDYALLNRVIFTVTGLSGVMLAALLYPLAKRGNTLTASRILVGVALVVVTILPLLGGDILDAIDAMRLLLPIILASILLTFWEVISVAMVVWLLHVMMAIALGLEFPSNYREATIFTGLYLVLLLAAARYRDRLEEERSHDVRQAEAHRYELLLHQQRIDFLARFIQGASHEFRTPLATIVLNADIIARTAPPGNLRRQAEGIQKQAWAMTELLAGMMQMVKVEQRQVLEDVETVNIQDVINICVQMMELRAAERQVEITVTVTKAEQYINGDRSLLAIGLIRVLENAVQHSPSPGVVRLEVSSRDQAPCIRIYDDGLGMSAEALQQATDPLYREDTARTSRGMGLGLTTAKRIIQLHGGSLRIESTPGQGTLVELLFSATE